MDLSEGEMHVQTLKVMDTLVEQSSEGKIEDSENKNLKNKIIQVDRLIPLIYILLYSTQRS